MSSFALYRCFSTSIPSTSKYLVRASPSILRKNPADHFGLLSYKKAPQTEKLKIPTWREEFSKKDKVLGWNETVPKRTIVKKVPEIVLPATLSPKKRRKIEAMLTGKTVAKAQPNLKSKESKFAKLSTGQSVTSSTTSKPRRKATEAKY